MGEKERESSRNMTLPWISPLCNAVAVPLLTVFSFFFFSLSKNNPPPRHTL